MPEFTFSANVLCDCGHESEFSENCLRGMREDSRKSRKPIYLAGHDNPSHMYYFQGGQIVAIYCPVLKKRLKWSHNDDDEVPEDEPAPTHRQGQYLAFIHNYTKINRRPPSEQDIQAYFEATPPTIHQMILRLEKNGFISRKPGTPRSIRILIPTNKIPPLE